MKMYKITDQKTLAAHHLHTACTQNADSFHNLILSIIKIDLV